LRFKNSNILFAMLKKLCFLGFMLSFHTASTQIFLSPQVKSAIDSALNHDVDLKNESIELQKMELERKSVLSKYIPKVEATALYGYLNSQGNLDLPTVNLPITGYPLFSGDSDFGAKGQAFHGGVTAKTVLFSGTQISNGAKALDYKNKGTKEMMDLKNDSVVKDVILSFDQLEMLKIAEQLIEETDKRLQKEKLRVDKAISLGLAIPYDRDKIKLAALELQSKRSDVHHKKELLTLKIKQATGIPVETIAQLQHTVDPILILADLSIENKKEIKALQFFQEASAYAIKKEKGTLLPTLGAFAGYRYSSLFNAELNFPVASINQTARLRSNHLTLNPSWMVGLAMKWELFSGFERKHKIEQAKLSALQLDHKLTDAKEKLALQLTRNKMTYENMLQQIDIAVQRQKIAENNNITAQKQYSAGLIGITERLSAENDLYQEALNKIETIIKQRQAAIDTYQAAGSLTTFIVEK